MLLDAFDHDIGFPDHLNDASFRFSFHTLLDDAARTALKSLLVAFYEDLLYDGFPECVHGDAERFDRTSFLRRFWLANPGLNVCPACDGQRPDRAFNTDSAETDHYLPKAKYAFLSMHPQNLVPMCQSCNSPFKLTRDPIDNGDDAPLVNVFLPYHRPALDFVTVLASRPGTGTLLYKIVDADGSRSRRVENLDRTFRLEERWHNRSDQVKGSVREALSMARRIIIRQGGTLDEVELRTELEEMYTERKNRIGKDHNYVLHASYIRFAIADNEEYKELRQQFEGR